MYIAKTHTGYVFVVSDDSPSTIVKYLQSTKLRLTTTLVDADLGLYLTRFYIAQGRNHSSKDGGTGRLCPHVSCPITGMINGSAKRKKITYRKTQKKNGKNATRNIYRGGT